MLLKLGDDALGEALARVPLDSHDALGATCKQLRKIVKSDNFGALRRQLGWTEYGVFVLAGISQESFERKDKYGQYDQSDDAFFCMTHKSDVAQPPRLFYDVGHKQLSVASCEEKGSSSRAAMQTTMVRTCPTTTSRSTTSGRGPGCP